VINDDGGELELPAYAVSVAWLKIQCSFSHSFVTVQSSAPMVCYIRYQSCFVADDTEIIPAQNSNDSKRLCSIYFVLGTLLSGLHQLIYLI
jgi:hypothetical protein